MSGIADDVKTRIPSGNAGPVDEARDGNTCFQLMQPVDAQRIGDAHRKREFQHEGQRPVVDRAHRGRRRKTWTARTKRPQSAMVNQCLHRWIEQQRFGLQRMHGEEGFARNKPRFRCKRPDNVCGAAADGAVFPHELLRRRKILQLEITTEFGRIGSLLPETHTLAALRRRVQPVAVGEATLGIEEREVVGS